MRDKNRSFTIDLSEPTAITYLNGMIARTPRAWAWMWMNLPPMWLLARKDPGCLQATPYVGSPRKLLLLSYWRDEAALRAFYAHARHVEMMRFVFAHQHWFTLFNETYRIPIATRYWNAPNGYALSQPWRPQSLQAFHDANGLHPEVADDLGLARPACSMPPA